MIKIVLILVCAFDSRNNTFHYVFGTVSTNQVMYDVGQDFTETREVFPDCRALFLRPLQDICCAMLVKNSKSFPAWKDRG